MLVFVWVNTYHMRPVGSCTRVGCRSRAVALSSADEGDDEDEVSSYGDVDAGLERASRRPSVGFKRRPRFDQHQGHARWYGEWDTGFWHQYINRANVENHPLLWDEFEERFRIPHELFCDFENEMIAAWFSRSQREVRAWLLGYCSWRALSVSRVERTGRL